jgi:NTP pyrophosphatase (non-canonical NTP hydrolase)
MVKNRNLLEAFRQFAILSTLQLYANAKGEVDTDSTQMMAWVEKSVVARSMLTHREIGLLESVLLKNEVPVDLIHRILEQALHGLTLLGLVETHVNCDRSSPFECMFGDFSRRRIILSVAPTLNSYQDLAYETAMYPGQNSFEGLAYCLFKLAGECGEVSEKMGKNLRGRLVEWNSHPSTWSPEVRDALKKEIGDVLWYLGGVSKELGFTLQEVAEANLAKLEGRQERGVIHGDGDNR